MRLELQMELLKPEIDIDYRRIIISYLKFALEHCEGGRFFEKFYKNRDNIVKDYCFSTVFSKPRFTKEKIYFDKNEMKIIFSCSDRNRTGLIFQTAYEISFSKRKSYDIEKNNTKKRSINYRICCVFSNNIGKWFMCA